MSTYSLRYTTMMLPGKLKLEVTAKVDQRSLYIGNNNTGKTISLSLLPSVILTIMRPIETDESGARTRSFNPNDSLFMSTWNLPIFLENLVAIKEGLKIPTMYTLVGAKQRLELNEQEAEGIRKVFKIGQTYVELSAIVILQEDETRIEGIKMKFNNETSSTTLTLNELDALIHNLRTLDPPAIALLMYTKFNEEESRPRSFTGPTATMKVDITPVTPRAHQSGEADLLS